MPNYEYLCSNESCECETFETYQSIKEDPLKICPFCGEESIQRTFHAVSVMVRQEPKTLGALADANRKKFGRALCEEKEHKIKQDRLRANEFVGTLPEGASKRSKKLSNRKVDLSLAKLNKEQQQKYIMTGRKP